MEAFVALYRSLGYVLCENSDVEDGCEKIVIYVGATGRPTHAARQLSSGQWTSKLGRSADVEHDSPEEVGALGESQYHYGSVAAILKRTVR